MHAASHPHRFICQFTHPFEVTDMVASLFNILAATTLFIAATIPYETDSAMAAAMWSLMPMVGALLASTMAFMFNRVSENRREVAGRVIGALVVGIVLPRALTYVHPIIKTVSLDPILLVGLGFAFGLLGYAGGAALVAKYFKEAPSIVDRQMDRLAEAVSQKVVRKTAENIDTIPVVEAVAETTAQKVVDKIAETSQP